MPIVMGMVAGVFLRFGLDLVYAIRDDFRIAAPMAAVFLALSTLPRLARLMPPLIGAMIVGGIMVAALGEFDPGGTEVLGFVRPNLYVPVFSWQAMIELVVPLAVTVLVVQNGQGIAVLRAAGHQPPINAITAACGAGHVLSSVLLGTVGIGAGVALSRLQRIESLRGALASYLLIGFGLAYAVWGLRRLKFAAFLGRIARVYDLGIVNSEEDRAALVATSPDWARVEVLPNGLDLGAYPLGLATPDPATLVFHGALSYAPNLQAVRLLVDEILPRVRAEVPGVRLLVTGRIPTDGTAPQGSGVVYTGYVPDIRTVVAGAWASPTPLKSGAGGARFKVLEALALGTPLISTAMGAEGLAVTDGVDILMAEEPAAFGAQTVRMLRSPELRQRLAEGGRRLVEQRYNWARLGERLAARLEDLVARRATARATSAVAPVGQ